MYWFHQQIGSKVNYELNINCKLLAGARCEDEMPSLLVMIHLFLTAQPHGNDVLQFFILQTRTFVKASHLVL